MTRSINGQKLDKVQKLANWFGFFLAFPVLDVLGNSISFYFFLAIIYQQPSFWSHRFAGRSLFTAFLTVVFFSIVLAPYAEMPRHPGIVSVLLTLVRYVYWVLVALFFVTYGRILNLIEIGRMFFLGTLLLLFGFFLLPISLDLGVISFNLRPARNTLVFNLLAATPLSLLYLIQRKNKTTVIIYFLLFIATMLISRGRAGPIILVLEFLLILLILFPGLTILSRFVLISLFTVFLFFGFDYDKMLNNLSNQVSAINPRLGRLLSEDRDATLGFDKSWLLRQLMIDKAIEITREHPITGIGVGNFVSYDSKLPTLTSYVRLLGRSMDYYNSRSAHNSYLQVLSETGLLGIFFFAIILIRPILYFLRILLSSSLRWKHLPLISLVGISIHFFVISSLTGAISWLVLGLAWSALPQKQKI